MVRRLLNIDDPREMNERLHEMMVSVLEEVGSARESDRSQLGFRRECYAFRG
jgi:hypothetical protein